MRTPRAAQLDERLRRKFLREGGIPFDRFRCGLVGQHSACVGAPLGAPQEIPFMMAQRGSEFVAEVHGISGGCEIRRAYHFFASSRRTFRFHDMTSRATDLD